MYMKSILHELKAMFHPLDDENAAIVLFSSLPQTWETFCSTKCFYCGMAILF